MALELRDAFECRRMPSPVEDCFFRPIQANGEIKGSVPGREPVRFLFGSGALILEVDVQRAVRIEFHRVAVADSVAVDRIRDEIAVLIVSSERPEGADRRKVGFVEVHPIAHGAAEELSRTVRAAVQIDGILRGISAYRKPRDGGSGEVVRSITAD